MACIEKIKTDLQKENKGIWVDFELGIRLKIARARNSAYRDLMRELTEPYREVLRDDKMEIEELEDLLRKIRAKTILLDWENIEDKDGLTIKYSSEQALEFFNDLELRDFYTFIIVESENMENFKKVMTEDAEKNLPASSGGSSAGGDIKVN